MDKKPISNNQNQLFLNPYILHKNSQSSKFSRCRIQSTIQQGRGMSVRGKILLET